MAGFSHLDKSGQVRMVDVSQKSSTQRAALARGYIHMNSKTFDKISAGTITKGSVLETARIAGIMAAKKTAQLIPMCHPLNLSHVSVNFSMDSQKNAIRIDAQVKINDRTGVEMEALTAVAISALTIYDMCKSEDKQMRIDGICLIKKSGGKSGTFVNPSKT